jgi:uncharacterized phage protein gp47/JayE
VIDNAPGLSAIVYRIGTFTSFRRAMLDQVARADLLVTKPNPFAGWHEGTNGDYHTLFIELWAYLADILTFYQERIANEAYLGTASQRDSLLRLVSLIDYRPNPGAGASGLVAFAAAKNSSFTIPAGFRVGRKALPGQPAVVFETSSALAVTGDNSVIPLSLFSPDVPFPPNTIVVQGLNNRLAVGDYLLAVRQQGTPEAAHLLRISRIITDKSTNTTSINWPEETGFSQVNKHDSVYALRVKAAPFGANAPQWDTLSPVLTHTFSSPPSNPLYPTSWDVQLSDGRPNPWFYIPVVGERQDVLFLDGVYHQLNYTEQNPGWAILLTGSVFQILKVIDSRQSTKVAYAVTLKVTRLTFAEDMFANVFPIRDTQALTGSELLALQTALPLLPQISGSQLILNGVHTQLQAGQTIVIRGDLFDPDTGATNTPGGESCVIDGPPAADAVNNVTVVNLKNPLANQYVRATCAVMANIVELTQGETVKDEVLGSSDGTALQSYALRKKPLTYLPSTDPEGLAAVKSTLNVAVNGVAWSEQPNLAQSAPDAQDFSTGLDDSNQTTVIFGDGIHGAKPPSGSNNIHARYRKGLGKGGNLPSDTIQQLIDSVPSLRSVTNPLPSSGGSDRDSLGQIRVAAPASLRTFSRAVSTPDYAALALKFPGIAKATATWILSDPVSLQAIAHPYVQLTVATVDQVPIQGTPLAGKLRQFLDRHRDPNVLLRLQDSSPVYLEVTVEVDIDLRYPHQGTLSQVQAALNPGENPDGTFGYFAFDRLQFGQSIFLSAVYAVVQNVAGVNSATITALRRVSPGLADTARAAHDIAIGPIEIAAVGPPGPADSRLTVSGQGGFIDT